MICRSRLLSAGGASREGTDSGAVEGTATCLCQFSDTVVCVSALLAKSVDGRCLRGGPNRTVLTSTEEESKMSPLTREFKIGTFVRGVGRCRLYFACCTRGRRWGCERISTGARGM